MNEIEVLKSKIKLASEAYGNANPIMSDSEFDKLINRLKELDPSYMDTVTYDDHTEGFPKGKHDLITGTLAKCRNEDEFREWFSRKNYKKFYVEEKADGCSLELKYKNGILVEAVTRGDGFEGDIVTKNALKIQDVVSNLSVNKDLSIRGEVVMTHKTYESKYKSTMKNCRNAAAGILKHLDGSCVEDLEFIAYDLLEISNKEIFTEKEKLSFLLNEGFRIIGYKEVNSIEEVFEYRKNLFEFRSHVDYDIDGIVIKPYEIDYEDLKNKTPKNSCALKFDLDKAVSYIENIEWSQTGKYFTPVAIVKPVEIGGVTVTKASCSNINWMIEKGIEIGKKCLIVRRGEIIPYIEEVLTN